MDIDTSHLPARPSPRTIALRIGLIAVGLLLWFWTQSLIGGRAFPQNAVGDGVHQFTAPVHAYLLAHPRAADALLIASSAGIDLLGVFLLGSAVLGRSVRPFVGLILLFALRQACQALCALPPPDGMIWRSPGVPSLLVTYGVANDLFFSGHTAIAVYGAIELSRLGSRPLRFLAVGLALFEVAVVLLLRAHYTMDVFTGAITALYVGLISPKLAAPIDKLIAPTPKPTP